LVRVLITVDTEVWPDSPGWPHTPLSEHNDCARELAWYFYGGDGPDAAGLPYQLRVLAAAGLKATYFVDPLFSIALGAEPLRAVVRLVAESGQEVGLHLHPEWLTDTRCAGLPAFAGPLLGRYAEADQLALVGAAAARLRAAGAGRIDAFRAGSWSATRATLRALREHGIGFDSSLNPGFDVSFPDLADRDAYLQPACIEGVWEFPVTTFVDRPPSARRPLHVCACSLAEFRTVLEHAAANGWFAVVIVLHSFEFVRVDRLPGGKPAAPQRLLARRFEHICDYLAAHRDRFQPCHFADLDPAEIPAAQRVPPPLSHRGRTAMRHLAQLASRVY
jgi:hypothetical protein